MDCVIITYWYLYSIRRGRLISPGCPLLLQHTHLITNNEREDYSSDDAKIYARIHSTVPTTILIEPGTTAHLVLAAVFESRPCPTSFSSVHFECLS